MSKYTIKSEEDYDKYESIESYRQELIEKAGIGHGYNFLISWPQIDLEESTNKLIEQSSNFFNSIIENSNIMIIKDKFFHSIHSYIKGPSDEQLEIILYKLECILKCGYILPYEDIEKMYGDNKFLSRHPWGRCNGMDRISIAVHSSKPEQHDYDYMKKKSGDPDLAFDDFILPAPSIVLNESLKDNYELIKKGIYLERQVRGKIDLKYMDAISIPVMDDIRSFFETPFIKTRTNNTFIKYDLDFIISLKELLLKYGYNVPIINIETGQSFNEKSIKDNKIKKRSM